MTQQNSGSFCEIQNGILAGEDKVSYKFLLKNGNIIIQGTGNRIIELREKKELTIGIGSFIPLYKTCNPSTQFECFEAKNNKYLGLIGIENRFTVKGFLSNPDFSSYIYETYIQQIYSELKKKEKYIDYILYEDGVFTSSFWDPHQLITLYLNEIDSIAPMRKVGLKRSLNYSRDSIPFSTYLGAPNHYHHEIVISDREKNEVILQRFLNNGKLALEVKFKGKNSLFQPNDKNYRSFFSLDPIEYNKPNKEKTIVKKAYNKT
ncbi:protein of unknown function [Tenacibaculum sp. 190524A02b]|uniref:hypothetical protein n=1 Tax=Tenacibaculum vairaonense TaxID=3137860 RepID=UPI0032B0FB34